MCVCECACVCECVFEFCLSSKILPIIASARGGLKGMVCMYV